MKLLISTLGLAICTPVLASDKLNEITGHIINNIELKQNQSFSNLVCGTGGCSVDLIEDNMVASTSYITEEYNPAANTLKIKISEHVKSLNTFQDAYILCLNNVLDPDKCKFFTQNELASMNYAFENGEFLKERSKRNTAVIKYVWEVSKPVHAPIGAEAKKAWEKAKREFNNWGHRYAEREVGRSHSRAGGDMGRASYDRSKQ